MESVVENCAFCVLMLVVVIWSLWAKVVLLCACFCGLDLELMVEHSAPSEAPLLDHCTETEAFLTLRSCARFSH